MLFIVMRHETDEHGGQEHKDERLEEGDEQFKERDKHRRDTTDQGNAADAEGAHARARGGAAESHELSLDTCGRSANQGHLSL